MCGVSGEWWGILARVVSSSATEMQVVAPAPLDGISQTYVIVNARGFTTSPQIVSVVATDPGLYPLPDGTAASPGGSLRGTRQNWGKIRLPRLSAHPRPVSEKGQSPPVLG